MIKFLIIAGCAFVLYKLFMGDRKNKVAAKNPQDNERLIQAGVMVKDPVCGTYVPKDNEIRVRKGDEVVHFCSYDCRDKYLKQIQAGNPPE